MEDRIKRVQNLFKALSKEMYYGLNFKMYLANADETTLNNLENLIDEINLARIKIECTSEVNAFIKYQQKRK